MNEHVHKHEKINYLEFPAKDIAVTKKFFSAVFDWSFTDYGPDYIAFSNAGIDGGFYQSDLTFSTKAGSVLIVFYSKEIETTQTKIITAGGKSHKLYLNFLVVIVSTLPIPMEMNMPFGLI